MGGDGPGKPGGRREPNTYLDWDTNYYSKRITKVNNLKKVYVIYNSGTYDIIYGIYTKNELAIKAKRKLVDNYTNDLGCDRSFSEEQFVILEHNLNEEPILD